MASNEIARLINECRDLSKMLSADLDRLAELTGNQQSPDHDHDTMSVGERIRWLRGGFGWSQEELAESSGLSVNAIINIENGYTALPRVTTITKIANALGVHPTELRGETWDS